MKTSLKVLDKVVKELVEVKSEIKELEAREVELKSTIFESVEDKTVPFETEHGKVSFVRVFAPYEYSAKTLKLKQEYETAKKIDEIKQANREVVSYSVRV